MDWINDFDSDSLEELFGRSTQRRLTNLEEEEVDREGREVQRSTDFSSNDGALMMSGVNACSNSSEADQSKVSFFSTSSSDNRDRGFHCQQVHCSGSEERHSNCSHYSRQKNDLPYEDCDFREQTNERRNDFSDIRNVGGFKKGKHYKLASAHSGHDIQCPNNVTCRTLVEHSDFHGNHSMTRNAIIARENRSKKKRYEESLKAAVLQLANENIQLKRRCQEKSNSIDTLVSEVTYLRGVLANSTALSILLRNIPNCLNLSLPDLPGTGGPNASQMSLRHLYSDPVTVDHNYAAAKK